MCKEIPMETGTNNKGMQLQSAVEMLVGNIDSILAESHALQITLLGDRSDYPVEVKDKVPESRALLDKLIDRLSGANHQATLILDQLREVNREVKVDLGL